MKDKEAHRQWREDATIALTPLRLPSSTIFEVVLDFFGPWLKNGKPDRHSADLKNMLWRLEDLIAHVLGYNDVANFRLVCNKHVSHVRQCIVTIRECPSLTVGQ